MKRISGRVLRIGFMCSWTVACSTAAAIPASTSSTLDAQASDDASFSFGSEFDPFTSDASLPTRVAAVLGSCGGQPESYCHNSGAGGLRMRLSGPDADIVDVPSTERPSLFRVKPYDLENSYLYLKLVGDGGIDGGRMPLNGPYDPRVQSLIGEWIEAGAATE